MVRHSLCIGIAIIALCRAGIALAFVPQLQLTRNPTVAVATCSFHTRCSQQSHHATMAMSAADKKHSFKSVAAATLAAMQVFSIGSPLLPLLVPDQAIAAATAAVAEAPQAAQERAVRGPFEETWDFINRFYVDRTYGGNDWAAVRTKYSKLIKSGKMSDTAAAKEVHIITVVVVIF
jgi:hypothetical protein